MLSYGVFKSLKVEFLRLIPTVLKLLKTLVVISSYMGMDKGQGIHSSVHTLTLSSVLVLLKCCGVAYRFIPVIARNDLLTHPKISG